MVIIASSLAEDVFMPRIVIFSNGTLPSRESARALLKPDDILIAADGGAHHILSLGLLPRLLVGDLDSLAPDALTRLESANVEVHRYPEDKDETDLELALQHALELGGKPVLVVGGLGGRIDHTLSTLSLLTNPAYEGLDLHLDDGIEEVFFCQASPTNGGHIEVQGKSGDIISLIPWGGQVTGIFTEGLRWRLSGETLYPEKSRGVSNILLEQSAVIQIENGCLFVIHRRTPETFIHNS